MADKMLNKNSEIEVLSSIVDTLKEIYKHIARTVVIDRVDCPECLRGTDKFYNIDKTFYHECGYCHYSWELSEEEYKDNNLTNPRSEILNGK